MLDNDRLKDNLYSILSNLDDFNNKDAKESDKLFALESVVNDFIKLTNALVSDYLFKQNLTIYKQQKNIERLKSFLEIDKELTSKGTRSPKSKKEPQLSTKEVPNKIPLQS